MNMIVVAKHFSPVPAGRYPVHGPFNGERFRKELLLPAFRSHDTDVVVDLDGVEGVGSSFLEESFGGLVREEGLDAGEVMRRLRIKSDEDTSLESEIRSYIEAAGKRISK